MKQFRRDKICGDAYPDALAALEALGVRDTVCASGRTLKGVKIYAPDGRAVVLNGDCAVVRGVSTSIFEQLRSKPERASWRLSRRRADRRRPARGRRDVRHATDGHRLDVDARWTICIGRGGRGTAHIPSGARVEASATAGRVYMRVPQSVALELPHLLISFDRQITQGYGWVSQARQRPECGRGVFHDRRRTRRSTTCGY